MIKSWIFQIKRSSSSFRKKITWIHNLILTQSAKRNYSLSNSMLCLLIWTKWLVDGIQNFHSSTLTLRSTPWTSTSCNSTTTLWKWRSRRNFVIQRSIQTRLLWNQPVIALIVYFYNTFKKNLNVSRWWLPITRLKERTNPHQASITFCTPAHLTRASHWETFYKSFTWSQLLSIWWDSCMFWKLVDLKAWILVKNYASTSSWRGPTK